MVHVASWRLLTSQLQKQQRRCSLLQEAAAPCSARSLPFGRGSCSRACVCSYYYSCQKLEETLGATFSIKFLTHAESSARLKFDLHPTHCGNTCSAGKIDGTRENHETLRLAEIVNNFFLIFYLFFAILLLATFSRMKFSSSMRFSRIFPFFLTLFHFFSFLFLPLFVIFSPFFHRLILAAGHFNI